ncbi:MAG: hypothetical protein HC923_13050 [Myxococcales bacterium]|nr:hypothetical protein [Myxococcales bacterium]
MIETPFSRASAVYVEPIAQIWIAAAARIGFEVVRSSEVYAHADGRGRIVIGTSETLDPDDHLGQMIFHEICHALIQGPDNLDRPDWGLDNTSDRDEGRERATLRLQRALAMQAGLTCLMAPTTDYRAFWDAIGDPHAGDVEEVALLRAGLERSAEPPFAPHLQTALRATRAIVRVVERVCGAEVRASGTILRSDASSVVDRPRSPSSR